LAFTTSEETRQLGPYRSMNDVAMLDDVINDLINTYKEPNQRLQAMFAACLRSTANTISQQNNGFIVTGDIPAMWLRDSTAQVTFLVKLAKSNHKVAKLIRGVIQMQQKFILEDSYANAFNLEATGPGWHAQGDIPRPSDVVWERKYELDSLCYHFRLVFLYHEATRDAGVFDDQFHLVVGKVVQQLVTEQHHENDSPYRFERTADWLLEEPHRIPFETLARGGKGAPTAETGMTWSGFRPSDDACKYGYHIPSNMMTVIVLKQLAHVCNGKDLAQRIQTLYTEIEQGIKKYGIVTHETFGLVYAYEVDGLGNYVLMDDANPPSLLSAPYFGFCSSTDEVYQNTLRMIFSSSNPYYYSGTWSGIGSSHSAPNFIWPLSIIMQGLNTTDVEVMEDCVNTLVSTDSGTHVMHESFHVDNPAQFTRPWFSWANSLFIELLLRRQELTKG
jgi:meiotically up-regulated gene 157 (Mug157) protein